MLPILSGKLQVEQAAIIFLFVKDNLLRDQKHDEFQCAALTLFQAYRDGTPDGTLVPDEELAEHYLAIALFLTPPKSSIDFFLTCLGWLTSIRLATVRSNRSLTVEPISSVLDSHFPNANHNHSLTGGPYGFFSTLQLSYGPEILLCLIKLFSKAFRQETNGDQEYIKKWPWFMQKCVSWFYRFEPKRFNQMLWTREFLSTFTNALAWFAVNIIVYHYFPVICLAAALYNLGGFAFDVWHDWRFANKELAEYQQLCNSINPPDSALEPLLSSSPSQDLLKILNLEQYKNQVLDAASKKIIQVNEKKFRVTWVAVGIFLGMMLVYAPVLLPQIPVFLSLLGVSIVIGGRSPDICKAIGAYIVIGAGVFWGGLGARLRAQIDRKKVLESSQNLVLNTLPLLALAGAFYLATAYLTVPALIFFACTVPIVPAIIQKYSHERLQEAAFNEKILSNNEPTPDFTEIEHIESNSNSNSNSTRDVLDIIKFAKLDSKQQGALRKVSGLSDDKQYLDVINHWSQPYNKRGPNSNHIIEKMLSSCKKSLSPSISSSAPLLQKDPMTSSASDEEGEKKIAQDVLLSPSSSPRPDSFSRSPLPPRSPLPSSLKIIVNNGGSSSNNLFSPDATLIKFAR